MTALPPVDEHVVEVAAAPAETWASLLATVHGALGRRRAAAYARLVGCDPPAGFAVTTTVPGELLALEGRHRFATYALTFRLDPLGDGRTRLRAETRAAFPGVGGRCYRAAVIGSGAHAALVRRLLRGVAARS